MEEDRRQLFSGKHNLAERPLYGCIHTKVHERTSNQRSDFAHQESRKIVHQYGRIFVEDIHINEMNSHRCLNRSIRDVAWSQFFFFLSYKARNAGREFRKVNPAGAIQDCSSCGHRQKMPLSTRTYRCPCCGMEKDRDYNASLNILRLG
ncbi:MAG: RNA-guided endonuclease InsQ/TnpB family protein [Leptospirillum sp.]